MEERKFYITFGTTLREVYPRNADKLKYLDEPEKDQMFYRTKLNGKLAFVNNAELGIDDFDFFSAIELSANNCNEIKLEIQTACGTGWITEWKGYFTTTAGSFDFDRCSFEVEAKVDDQYRCLLDNWEEKKNMLDLNSIVETTGIIPQGSNNYEYAFWRQPGGSMGDLPLPTASWKILHNEQDFSQYGQIIHIFFREYAVTSCVAGAPSPPSGSGWMLENDDCINTNTAKYVRQPLPTYPNPNPDVFRGVCDSGVAVEPPVQIKTIVTLQNGWGSMIVGDVRGRTQVCGTETGLKYSIDAPDNSTLQWGFVFTSMVQNITNDTTKTVSFDMDAPAGGILQVQCFETTVHGDQILHGIAVNVVDSQQPGLISWEDVTIYSPKILCSSQTNIKFTVPEEYRFLYNGVMPTIAWTVHPGLTIVGGQGTWELTCDVNGTVIGNNLLLVTFSSFIDNDCLSAASHVHGQVSGDITPHPITEPIQGLTLLNSDATNVHYKVHERSGANFQWLVFGGTILSGQGTNEIIVDWDSIQNNYDLFVKENFTCGCTWIEIAGCTVNNDIPYFWCPQNAGTYTITLDRNRWLYEVIEYLMTFLPCGALYEPELISDFLNRNPVGDSPNYVVGENYVTQDINRVDLLTIAAKSDIKLYNSSNPATIAEISLSRLLKIMREVFKVYWKLVPNLGGTWSLRLEHYVAFRFLQGLDTTTAEHADATAAKNKYDHLNETLYKYERFKWMEAQGTDFIGTEIHYDSLCVNQDNDSNAVETHVNDVTTDLLEIVTNPNDIDNDGFVILANEDDGSGGYQVINEVGRLSNIIMPNAHMSWANLHYNYHRYERQLGEGYMNNTLETFFLPKPNIKQTPMEIKLCCDDTYEPDKGVITELGYTYLGGIDGRIFQAERPFNKRTVKLILLYSYYAS